MDQAVSRYWRAEGAHHAADVQHGHLRSALAELAHGQRPGWRRRFFGRLVLRRGVSAAETTCVMTAGAGGQRDGNG